MEYLEKIEQGIIWFLQRFVTILAIIMTIVIFAQVFSRTFLAAALPWSEELGRYLFVWVTFLGGSLALQSGAHLGIDALFRTFPDRLQIIMKIITNALLAALFVVIVKEGIYLVSMTGMQKSAAMQMPMSWAYLALPLSGITMLYMTLVAFIKNIAELFGKGGAKA